MKNILIKNVNIITPFKTEKIKNVFLENGRIQLIYGSNKGLRKEELNNNTKIYDFGGKFLVPGFIDIHTHGAVGIDSSSKLIRNWIDFKYRNGVTAFIPTLLPMSIKDINNCLINLVGEINRNDNLCGLLGINMEGPYINPKFGMQISDVCVDPKKDDYKKFLEITNGILKIMTLAPELNSSGELIKELIKNNVIVSIGHTDASMEQTNNAIELGANLATHLFNAFGYSKGFFKETRKGKICGVREVRALDILLENDDVYAEVIADKNGIHVDPILLRTLVKCKPIDKIILITDSMKFTGLKAGKYNLPDGRTCSFKKDDDVIFLKKHQVLSGSVLRLKDAVNNLIRHTGISLNDAIKMITINPAKLLGVDEEIGSIEVGKKANLVVMDENFFIYLSVAGGQVVYEA